MSNGYNPYGPYAQQPPPPGTPPTGGAPRDLFPSLWQNDEDLSRATSSCLARVFLRMFIALLVTAAVSYGIYTYQGSFAGYNSIYDYTTGEVYSGLMVFLFSNIYFFYGLMIAQLLLVIVLAVRVMKMSSTASNIMFFIYAIMTGITLSVVFLAYTTGVIFQAFMVTAMTFGAMALYGTITRRDLTKIGSLCFMGLIGIIIASIINMFVGNDTLTMIINYIGVLIFVGLTAYDTQRIKRMLAGANSGNADSVIVAGRDEAIKRISVMGALMLYLDFINLFLKILAIMGRRR
ncbi:MAG: Bax inhibitor-1/YccA family protein [Oscillospiraceae bacterium]|nr:Bax inhibitor-1/YccA family protein [Oscillospiraceae bacterium]